VRGDHWFRWWQLWSIRSDSCRFDPVAGKTCRNASLGKQ
jgi:hypothetical protein